MGEKAAASVCQVHLTFAHLPNPSVILPASFHPHLQIRKLRGLAKVLQLVNDRARAVNAEPVLLQDP